MPNEGREWTWKRIARVAGGWLLILAGVAGLLLPIAPGIPFILGGLALLACEYVSARRWLDKAKEWIARFRNRNQPEAKGKPAQEEARPSGRAGV